MTENNGLKIKEILERKFTITVETGLRIGGMEEYEIGGLDNPVIKTKILPNKEKVPYIPGSSLKGKMRSLLELTSEVSIAKEEDIHSCGNDDCEICQLFGFSTKENAQPGALVVRDCFPETMQEDLCEVKVENVIDRNKGTSKNLRQMERVVPGTRFKGSFILKRYEKFKEEFFKRLQKKVEEAIKLLENDYLGGCGTRGYGKVKIEFDEEQWERVWPK